MEAIGNKSAAKNFQVAAINAATGKVVEAAAAANAGITKLKTAIKNATLV
jgi:glucose dehydrogenase